MKKFLLMMFLLIIGSSYVQAADIADSPDNRQAAAERYLAVAPMEWMMHDAIEKMADRLPSGQRETFVEIMTQYVRTDVIKRAAASSMVRHFTVRELNALADFYGSPEGRSAMTKFGAYMADVMPVIQQEMARALQQYKEAR